MAECMQHYFSRFHTVIETALGPSKVLMPWSSKRITEQKPQWCQIKPGLNFHKTSSERKLTTLLLITGKSEKVRHHGERRNMSAVSNTTLIMGVVSIIYKNF